MSETSDFLPVPVGHAAPDPERFWAKVRRTVGRIPFTEDLLAAWYCAIDRDTPGYVRAVLLGAAAYFVLPADVVPDFIAGLGYTDDASVIAAALSAVGRNITPRHRERARATVDELTRQRRRVLARRLKGSLKGLLAQRGYELSRLPDRGPFEAQRRLLLGHRVRTVFDLGAFVGDVTARYRSIFPDATVYSFEPFAGSFETLAERFRGDEFVKPQPLAVADQVGAAVLYVNGLAATNSLLPRPSEGQRYFPSDGETVATERVRTTTIEAFCGEHGLATIDVLKLDVQGGELAALRGAEGLLRKRAVGLIYTEASFVPHYRGAPLFHDVAALLAGHGYGLYNIYDMVRARNGQLRFADALFVSPAVRRRAIDDPPL